MSLSFGSIRRVDYVSDTSLDRSQRRRVLDGMVRRVNDSGGKAAAFTLDGQDYFLRDDAEGFHASDYANRRSDSRPTSYVAAGGWAMPAGYRQVPKTGKALRAAKSDFLEKARLQGPVQTLSVTVERVGRRLKAVFDDKQKGQDNGSGSQVSPLPG